jgi:hypothetical protein
VLDWVGKSFYFYLYVAYFFITFRVFYFIKQIHILHKAYGFYLECKVLNTKTIIDMTDNKDVK